MAFNKETGLWEGFIYCITNQVNGKRYIGQTLQTINKRWSRHLYNDKTNEEYALYKAFKKYGVENFIKYELEKIECSTREELSARLNERETYHIANFDTYLGDGYNLTRGGARISESHLGAVCQYDLDANFIAEYECANIAGQVLGISMSHILDCCRGIHKTHKGYIWEFKGNIPIPITNQRAKYRRVVQYDFYGNIIQQWDSIVEASSSLGLNNVSICSCCKGKYMFSGDFVWRYAGDSFDKYQTPNMDYKIFKYSKSGELIDSYRSVAEASEHNNIHKALIYRVLRGGRPSAGGYIWKNIDQLKGA